jgi:hypothetical protein
LKAKFHDLLSLYKSQEDEELFAALDSSLSPLKRSSPRLLLKFFTHGVKSASEFSEKLRVPEKAMILAESFFDEIREWLEGERLIDRCLLSIHRSRRLTQHQKQVLWCHPKAFNPQRRKRKVWLPNFITYF